MLTQGRGINGTQISTVLNPADCTVANGVDSTATGLCANAGTRAGVNGATSTIVATGATAYGAQAQARDTNTTAIGFRATANFEGSVAIGYQARALADPTTAVGSNSLASGNDSVALGASAEATATRAVALGAYSVADQPNTVSVGSPGAERRITNVAPGVSPTDAVNVSQLQGLERQAYSGVALSMAMSGTYMPTLEPGEKSLGVGMGAYRGYGAIAINFRALGQDGKTTWGFGVSTNGTEWGFNLGTSWKWR
jgi:trimeric autotransporter adhesin